MSPSIPADRTASGDLADTIVAVFGAGGGAALAGAQAHEIGTSETFANNQFTDVSSTVTDNGDGTRTVDITWLTNDGFPLFGPDGFGPGDPITDISFELGENNAGTNPVDDPDFISFDHPEDASNPGTFLAEFNLLGADGTSVLFSGNFFVQQQGSGFSGLTFVGAGGADLGTFGIGGASASITYNIPAPGAVSLAGLAGLAAVRRRR